MIPSRAAYGSAVASDSSSERGPHARVSDACLQQPRTLSFNSFAFLEGTMKTYQIPSLVLSGDVLVDTRNIDEETGDDPITQKLFVTGSVGFFL